ncbi:MULTISPECIES: thioredoxin-dependent thiol peroxidase [Neobacillus]|uniref:thioredoxin-dependent peroxiredoxin n=2 Tax=Neobacillus TaxID=2675232 RepID=A0A6B3TQC1_9BACI|nr:MULTISPECIES: thioredoxin-dependent thiol peroxidase [Neobacillus]AIM17276.1 peroxiredoxin [Bacillus sp. X1(2014)]MCD4839988.1 thioredoxin-dependent thiol peroxidase [Neobacillus sedimentimangrovi]MED3623736.1 thioredoxin-dependent thiol peroxidase [Neobacillus thermocopriae]MED3713055.1 thioredoxin-dependent thiol peroxidase [Neobacillus thermocopriae]NEX79013.1 thioredoxin-dependent thiol peroxidase [Neobacillus thermocopriae]
MTVEVGKQAPDFTLTAHNGETVTLSNLKGKNVVLYFYPKDMTPGCTTEACDFRDQYEQFAELNAVILGVSPDPVERHQKFVDKYGLPFLLLADTDHQVAEAYGVWKLKKNFGKEYMGIERSTFIIDKEGIIVKEWRKVQVKGHVEAALNYIKENL